MTTSRLADRISVARSRWRADRASIEALAEAVADITLELAGHRTRTDAELTLLRERLDRYQREAGEREARYVSRLTLHVEEHHVAHVGLKETT